MSLLVQRPAAPFSPILLAFDTFVPLFSRALTHPLGAAGLLLTSQLVTAPTSTVEALYRVLFLQRHLWTPSLLSLMFTNWLATRLASALSPLVLQLLGAPSLLDAACSVEDANRRSHLMAVSFALSASIATAVVTPLEFTRVLSVLVAVRADTTVPLGSLLRELVGNFGASSLYTGLFLHVLNGFVGRCVAEGSGRSDSERER